MPRVCALSNGVKELIQSAQVITCLSDAAKELVENAIDASAHKISVKFHNYGIDAIEVVDDGTGVPESELESLVASHATSKLQNFTDLESLSTLGFRGEALSSICAMSELSVTSCTKETYPRGFSVVYTSEGSIKSRTSTSAQIGTIIKVTNLFGTLPVRRRDFEKNAKREYGKAIKLMQSYASIQPDIRLEVLHITPRTRTHALGAHGTTGSHDSLRTLTEIFGSKSLSNVVRIDTVLEVKSHRLKELTNDVKLQGYISNPLIENQHQSEHQMTFINSRPCHLPMILKTINEVCTSNGGSRKAFVCLDLKLATDLYDVNVSPDKRTIFLHNERQIVQHLFDVLESLFTDGRRTIASSQIDARPVQPGRSTLKEIFELRDDRSMPMQTSSQVEPNLVKDYMESAISSPLVEHHPQPSLKRKRSSVTQEQSKIQFQPAASIGHAQINIEQEMSSESEPQSGDEESSEEASDDADADASEDDQVPPSVKPDSEMIIDTTMPARSAKAVKPLARFVARLDNMMQSTTGHVHELKINMDSAPALLPLNPTRKCQDHMGIENAGVEDSAIAAERSLSLHISKDDFFGMNIIGQFNLGFILTERHGEVFIIDQHASDEKANYERLIAETHIKSQKMARPQKLELNSIEKLGLGNSELIHLLQRNGFDIVEDEQTDWWLTSLPVSRNIAFGLPDLLELLTLYESSPTEPTRLRCTKAKRMFASRACRSSIMIGTALKRERMESVVYHMGELDLPWNCPHGRPTMRHLVSLDTIPVWRADVE